MMLQRPLPPAMRNAILARGLTRKRGAERAPARHPPPDYPPVRDSPKDRSRLVNARSVHIILRKIIPQIP